MHSTAVLPGQLTRTPIPPSSRANSSTAAAESGKSARSMRCTAAFTDLDRMSAAVDSALSRSAA